MSTKVVLAMLAATGLIAAKSKYPAEAPKTAAAKTILAELKNIPARQEITCVVTLTNRVLSAKNRSNSQEFNGTENIASDLRKGWDLAAKNISYFFADKNGNRHADVDITCTTYTFQPWQISGSPGAFYDKTTASGELVSRSMPLGDEFYMKPSGQADFSRFYRHNLDAN